MVYSVDPAANKENPVTPSAYLSMTEQLLYKIASLETSVTGGFRRLDEKMDRFQSDLHEGQIATNDRINRLDKELNEGLLRKRQRLDNLEKHIAEEFTKAEDRSRDNCQDINKRVNEMETWQKVLTARFSLAGGSALLIITFIAPFIRHAFGVGS